MGSSQSREQYIANKAACKCVEMLRMELADPKYDAGVDSLSVLDCITSFRTALENGAGNIIVPYPQGLKPVRPTVVSYFPSPGSKSSMSTVTGASLSAGEVRTNRSRSGSSASASHHRKQSAHGSKKAMTPAEIRADSAIRRRAQQSGHAAGPTRPSEQDRFVSGLSGRDHYPTSNAEVADDLFRALSDSISLARNSNDDLSLEKECDTHPALREQVQQQSSLNIGPPGSRFVVNQERGSFSGGNVRESARNFERKVPG